MSVLAVIPARYASSRFPGKPLARETGKYLIQHVYEQVSKSQRIDEVIVATDDERIFQAVEVFGGRVAMTRDDHPSGTDRVAEVAKNHGADIIVNVQGDEPEIEPDVLDTLVGLFANDLAVSIGTLACPFPMDADPRDPNAVKVVCDVQGRALFFSRSLIPYPRATQGNPGSPGDWLLHLGCYAYRRETLMALCELSPTRLEQTESLEQLRFLESGYAIHVGVVAQASVGIDTPADYAAFVKRMRRS